MGIKKFPLSRRMINSHSKYINARGRHRAYNKLWEQRLKDWADPRFPLKIKLYQVRKWPKRMLDTPR